MSEMRVQKYLSKAGVCSRREGEELMEAGRVTVDGEVCDELGSKVDPEAEVAVDGEVVDLPDTYTYVLLNKPADCITTLDDPQGRETVMDWVPDALPRLWPVGRLDRETTGALLLTNDGDLTHRLTHPSFGARKYYRAVVEGEIQSEGALADRFTGGIELDDGDTARAQSVEIDRAEGGQSELSIVLTEGQNRQIRRMCDAVGHPVVELERTAIGPIGLGDLGPGEWRRLNPDEVAELYDEVDTDPPDRAPAE
ncbi:MAG: pseudouridine synthase [Bradymonadaceae bacterium]